MMGLKRMLEKLGLAKTHLELKKMISEVAGSTSKDTISYDDFLRMMLGKRNAILKLWVWNSLYSWKWIWFWTIIILEFTLSCLIYSISVATKNKWSRLISKNYWSLKTNKHSNEFKMFPEFPAKSWKRLNYIFFI